LRRLAEEAQENLGAYGRDRRSGVAGDYVHRMPSVLEHRLGRFEPETLDRLGW
jgi:hypothetical protein